MNMASEGLGALRLPCGKLALVTPRKPLVFGTSFGTLYDYCWASPQEPNDKDFEAKALPKDVPTILAF